MKTLPIRPGSGTHDEPTAGRLAPFTLPPNRVRVLDDHACRCALTHEDAPGFARNAYCPVHVKPLKLAVGDRPGQTQRAAVRVRFAALVADSRKRLTTCCCADIAETRYRTREGGAGASLCAYHVLRGMATELLRQQNTRERQAARHAARAAATAAGNGQAVTAERLSGRGHLTDAERDAAVATLLRAQAERLTAAFDGPAGLVDTEAEAERAKQARNARERELRTKAREARRTA